jgi:diacylglycerol kinase
MIDERTTPREAARAGGQAGAVALMREPGAAPGLLMGSGFASAAPAEETPPEPTTKGDCRNTRGKLTTGWRGLKSAVRGDSSFFAHGYRGTLIAITAALLGVNQWGWCLLVIGAMLVLIAELAYSAVDTLARSIGDPEEPRLKNAREIAAGGVLVAAVGSGAVTLIVLSWKFAELLGWGP